MTHRKFNAIELDSMAHLTEDWCPPHSIYLSIIEQARDGIAGPEALAACETVVASEQIGPQCSKCVKACRAAIALAETKPDASASANSR